MKRVALALLLVCAPAVARAADFTEAGDDLAPRDRNFFSVDGALRIRGDVFYNLDLDRGLTPSGTPLFPVSRSHPKSQTLSGADTRLRTDLAAFAPGGSLAVKGRVDVQDATAVGDGPAPQAALRVKRLYGEVLTPFGLLSAGRMASTWGLGILANGGDGEDADLGDAADRIGFVTPIAGLLWGAAYDHATLGPTTKRDTGDRAAAFDPSDAMQTVTFAVVRWRDDASRERRRGAGKTTLEGGLVGSHRWQDSDVSSAYGGAGTTLPRGFTANALDGWARITGPWGRIEAEGAILEATVRQASLVPGVLLRQPIHSHQQGGALETEFGLGAIGAGLDAGFASGDPQPGFGANPQPGAAAARPGDLDGPQASLPGDSRVDNFRFHPEYRIDRILFHEIVGTVTDAVYLRPHVRGQIAKSARGALVASVAGVWSRAIYASSTPGGKTPLGVEIDPTLAWESADGFAASLEHAVLFPLAGLDNPEAGMRAKPAQRVRLRLQYRF